MKCKIKINFKNDYNLLVHRHLLSFGFQELPNDLIDSLRIYFNYKNRIVESIEWNILKSKNLNVPNHLITGFTNLENKLKKGENIKANLSTRIVDPLFFDSLLNDWGIHHLHLGDQIESNGFVTRNDEVLFVKFVNLSAYFIAIGNHQSWSDKNLLKVVDDNWPELLEKHELKGIIDISQNPTSEEIGKLRKAGINSCVEINNKVYASIGGGFLASGDNAMSSIATGDILNRIRNLEEYVQQNEKLILKNLKGKIGKLPPVIEGKLVVDENRNCYLSFVNLKINFKLGVL